MTHLIMLFIPVIGICGIIYKLPENIKEKFFSAPIWITSTAFSFGLKFFVHGVMGPYAVILGDLILFPIFTLWKKSRTMKKNFIQKQEEKRKNNSSIASPKLILQAA